MAKPLTYNATLIGRIDYTKELAVFRVRHDTPIEASPPFVPGQYVALGLNNEDNPELASVRRSMSLAGAPEEGNEAFEFYIRYVSRPESNNPLTHLLWPKKVGDRIFMTRKPVGKFTLPDTLGSSDSRLNLCVAAGTGLAPFVSMVRSQVMQNAAADLSDYAILHGASYPADLVYRDELTRYQTENNLRYLCTISRPEEAPSWQSHTGRVEDFFAANRLLELERLLGLDSGELTPKRVGVLICGLQGTIAQTLLRLVPRGFIPDNRRIRAALEVPKELAPTIWWEQYDKTPVINVNDDALINPLKNQLLTALAS